MNRLTLENLHGGPLGIVCSFLESPQILEQTSKSLYLLLQEEGYSEYKTLIDASKDLLNRCSVPTEKIDPAFHSSRKIKDIFRMILSSLIPPNRCYLSLAEPTEADWSQIQATAEQIETEKGEILIEFSKKISRQHSPLADYLKELDDLFYLDLRPRSDFVREKAEKIRTWMKVHGENFPEVLFLDPISRFPKEICLLNESLNDMDREKIFRNSVIYERIDVLEEMAKDFLFSQIARENIDNVIYYTVILGLKRSFTFLSKKYHPFISKERFKKAITYIAKEGDLPFFQLCRKHLPHLISWPYTFFRALGSGQLNFAKVVLEQTPDPVGALYWFLALEDCAENNHLACIDFILKNCPVKIPFEYLEEAFANARENGHEACARILFTALRESKCWIRCSFSSKILTFSFCIWRMLHSQRRLMRPF